MSRFINEAYAFLTPYTPGEQPKSRGLIKLNTNENPYPPSPQVVEVYNSREAEQMRLYPDPDARALVDAVAEYYEVGRENVIAGNGSDELLAFSFMAFQNAKKKFYYPNISYGFYRVFAGAFGADATELPLTENMEINIDDYKNLDGTIVIANPNAPTGIALTRGEIEEILKANKDNLVIIDEAYVDFGAESCVPLIKEYDNLLVIQTLSKSRNLAGARVGIALACEDIVQDLNKVKYSFNPYNLSRLSIMAGAAAMNDREYFWKCTAMIKCTRDYFISEMKLLGFEVLPSKANFILAKYADSELSGTEYFQKLRESDILVRHFDMRELEDYVRISIGTMEEMQELIAATKRILQGMAVSKRCG